MIDSRSRRRLQWIAAGEGLSGEVIQTEVAGGRSQFTLRSSRDEVMLGYSCEAARKILRKMSKREKANA